MNNQLSWTTVNKVFFRFAFIFIFGFIVVKNNGAYPLFSFINKPIIVVFQKLTPWFSKNILDYTYDFNIFSNGSGDTSYDWVSLSIIFLAALIGCLIWSILDRKRSSYNSLYYYLTVLIRYYIAFMLFNYGAIKLMHAQMPPPNLHGLMQPLHEFSPMGLAWTFLGFSKGYNIFMGIVEIMALLLLFRRTMVLGALITFATSINIMTVNYFFDVPVKMVSSALLLLSLFLLIPNIKVLYSFFVKGKPENLYIIQKPIYKNKWMNKTLIALKIIIISVFAVTQVHALINREKQIAKLFKQTSIKGIYQIDRKSEKSNSIPEDWKYMIFEFEGNLSFRDVNYQRGFQEFKLDEKSQEITINRFKFKYKFYQNGDILLEKDFPTHKEEIRLLKLNHEKSDLLNRGFNLIQEYPYNR